MKKITIGESREKTPSPFNYISIFIVSIMLISLLSIIFTLSTPGAAGITGSDPTEADFELVRGYFNSIEYPGSMDETSLELTHPEGIVYAWSYSNGEWSGDLDHLHEEGSSYREDSDMWTVSIAVDNDVPTDGEWTLVIDDSEYNVGVVEPDESFSISGSASFTFEPNMGDVHGVSDSISIGNQGNVLMSYDLMYSDENLEYEGDKEILAPGETGNLVLYYNYSTSGAEIFTVELSILRKVVGVLDLQAEDSHQVKSRGAIVRDFLVMVGYDGFEYGSGDSYTVQYERSISIDGNTYGEITFYIYPKENIYLSFNKENVTFDDENITIMIRSPDSEEQEEIDYDPTEPLVPEYDEVKIIVEFKSHYRDDGSVELVVLEEGYTTSIQIGQAASEPGKERVSFVEEEKEAITLGAVLIGGIIAFGAARILLSKRKKD